MKTRYCLFISTFILTASISGCRKDSNNSRHLLSNDDQLIKQASTLANKHSEALDYIYDQMSVIQQQRETTLNNESASLKPPPSNDPPVLVPFPDYTFVTDKFLRNQFGLRIEDIFYENPDTITNSMDIKSSLFDHNLYWMSDYISAVYQQNFSSQFNSSLKHFQAVLESTADTLLILFRGDSIIDASLPLLSDTLEKVILLSVIKVGINSSGYWERNENKWQLLADSYYGAFNAREDLINARGPGGDIAKSAVWADMIGAAGGAISGAVNGAVGGTFVVPGVGTIAGTAAGGLAGMISGSITGSAGSAFWDYVRVKWDWNSLPFELPPHTWIESNAEHTRLMSSLIIKEPI